MLNVLIGGGSNNERWDVDQLLADSYVLSSNKDASVMNRRSEFALNNESLKASFHELGNSQSQDEIELALSFLKKTKSDHPSDDGLT